MIELTVTHDGDRWVAANETISAAAPTLDELDAKIGAIVRGSGRMRDGETLRVRMACDNSIIPQWIRQYAQHYFNRIILVKA
ncbi:MAG: DUF5395 family protein [Elusimicrobiota bacterium]